MGTYLLCSRSADGAVDHPLSAVLRREAEAAGMEVADLSDNTWLAVAGPGAPGTRTVGPWLLVGDAFHRRHPRFETFHDAPPADYEKKLLARFWGRFIGVRLDSRGRLAGLLRDPSGALDCIWWTRGPLTLAASDIPDWLARVPGAGAGWKIDPARVEAALHDPYSTSGELLLDGPTALLPGTLQDFPGKEPVVLWRPDWIVRSARPMSDEAAAGLLRDAVDQTLAGVIETGGVLAAEISGGLDSAITAAALARAGRDRVRLWLNAWGPDPAADERPWAALVGASLGVEVASVPRATGRLTLEGLESLALGVRPGLAALDGLHDADWARRFVAAGVETVVTGKGGDAVFIQPADAAVFLDIRQERGWRALVSPAVPNLARWNERSVWTLLRLLGARRPLSADEPNPLLARRRNPDHPRHPWLRHIGDLGPTRRRQILGLVQGCALHGPSLQTRAVSVIHPLLAQPVTEACLSIPIGQLTLGRRDRGLARQAFADRLPAPLVARRTKGEMTAFYGRLIADALDLLRPWLLEGGLAAMGLIDRDRADAALTRESLAWRGGYVDIMTTAAIEAWVRAWERRLPGA